MKAYDEIMEIVTTKGLDLMQSDIDEIEALVVDIPVDDLPTVYPWIWERIALVVNDSLYEGDIEPIE